MSATNELSGIYRRLPLVLATAQMALVTSFAYLSLAQGEPLGIGLPICLGIVLVGAALSEIFSGGFQFMPRELGRDILGIAILFCMFVTLTLLAQFRILPRDLRGWELIVGCACAFMFFLHSQRSFLLMASLQAFLLMGAVLFREGSARMQTFSIALVYTGIFVLQVSLLFHRERLEETSTAGRGLDTRLPARSLPVCLGVLLTLFTIFFALSPAESVTFDQLIGRGAAATGKLSGSNALERWLPEESMVDPFARWAGEESAAGVLQQGIAFEKDLKFGDVPTGSGHPDTVAMYVRLVDAEGRPTRGENLPLFWKTGVVYRYHQGQWTGDSGLGPEIADAQDGAVDGSVRWKLQPPRCATVAIEQRIILWPQPTPSLFALYPAESIGLDRVHVDSEGVVSRASRFDGPFKYRVLSRLAAPTDAELEAATWGRSAEKYTDIPKAVKDDPAFKAFIKDVASRGKAPHAIASAAMQLLGDFDYTVTPKFPPGQDPTLAFLRYRRGYCQHYASALCTALRQFGYAARIGVGFTRGDWNEDRGVYIVRRKHAHAWVELLLDGIGWVPYDVAMAPAMRWMVQGEREDPIAMPTPFKSDRKVPTPVLDPPTPLGSGSVKPPPPMTTSATPPNTAIDPPSTTTGVTPPSTSTAVLPPNTAIDPPTPSSSADVPVPERLEEKEFEALWGTIENKMRQTKAGDPVIVDPGAGSGSGGKGDSPWGPSGGDGNPEMFGRISSAIARILRDLLIVLAAAGLIGAIIALFLRLRRGREGGTRQGAVVVDEHYLDEEGLAELAGMTATGGRHPRRRRVVEIYGEFLDRLARLGFKRSPAQTATEYAAYLGERLALVPKGVHTLTDLFQSARYGEGDASSEQVEGAESALRESLSEVRGAKRA